MPPLLADFTHARPCKPFCEKYLTLPLTAVIHENHSFAIQCFYGDTFKAAKRMIWRKDNIVFIINKRYEV